MSFLHDMDDEEFRDAVAEEFKGLGMRPAWWLRFLKPDIIDRTEDALDDLCEDVERQARDGNASAGTFRKKLNKAVMQVQLERALHEGES